jgi:hypothetical protein
LEFRRTATWRWSAGGAAAAAAPIRRRRRRVRSAGTRARRRLALHRRRTGARCTTGLRHQWWWLRCGPWRRRSPAGPARRREARPPRGRCGSSCQHASMAASRCLHTHGRTAALPKTHICPQRKERSSTSHARNPFNLNFFDSAQCLMVRRWRLIGYFPILYNPQKHTSLVPHRVS